MPAPANCAVSAQRRKRGRPRAAGKPAALAGASGPGRRQLWAPANGRAGPERARPPAGRRWTGAALRNAPLQTCFRPSAPLHPRMSRLACPLHGEPLVQKHRGRTAVRPFLAPGCFMTDTLSLLKLRRSVPPQFLTAPGPDADQLRELLTIGARVPDHGKLAPWRFIIFSTARRARRRPMWSAQVFRAKNPEADDEKVAFERKRLTYAPVIVAVVSRARPHVEDSGMGAGAVGRRRLHEHARRGAGDGVRRLLADQLVLLRPRRAERLRRWPRTSASPASSISARRPRRPPTASGPCCPTSSAITGPERHDLFDRAARPRPAA